MWYLTPFVAGDGAGKSKRSGDPASLVCFRLGRLVTGIIKI